MPPDTESPASPGEEAGPLPGAQVMKGPNAIDAADEVQTLGSGSEFDPAMVETALRMFAPDGDLQLVSIDPFDCPEQRRPPRTFMVRGQWLEAVEWIHRENRS